MIEWITNWAQGIIIAVIIATIIEMILPNGSCKKYIKVVIGVYILFSIISPVISKITGKGFNISEELNLEVDSKAIYNSLDKNNSNNIMDIYVSNLKSDIISKLKNKGYETIECEVKIKNEETYEIEALNLNLKKIKSNNADTEEENNNEDVEKVKGVNDVNIEINGSNNKDNNIEDDNDKNNSKNNTNNKDYNSDLTVYEKNKVKEYLETTYEINKKSININ